MSRPPLPAGPAALARRVATVLERAARTLPGPLGRHPRLPLSVGLVALVSAVIVALAYVTQGAPPRAAATGPTFTYTGTWTLLELQQHVEAGEVVAIGVDDGAGTTGDASNVAGDGTSGAPQYLAAKTRDGQLIRVALNVSAADAVTALSALGDGRLLTDEAWQSVEAAPSGGGGGFSPLLGEVVLFAMFGILLFVLLRVAARPGGRRESGPNFRTIMPPPQDPKQAAGTARPTGRGEAVVPTRPATPMPEAGSTMTPAPAEPTTMAPSPARPSTASAVPSEDPAPVPGSSASPGEAVPTSAASGDAPGPTVLGPAAPGPAVPAPAVSGSAAAAGRPIAGADASRPP